MIKKKKILYDIKADWMLYLLLLIPMCFLFMFNYKPMYGIVMAFQDYNVVQGISGSPWIGFDVFKQIFSNPEFYKVLRNTLMLNFMGLITGFPAPIILAILLNEVRVQWFKRLSQTLLYLPHFLSWVIIAGLMYQLFAPSSGLVNIIIMKLGGQPVPFLTDPWHWVVSYNIIGVWFSAGWGTIIYLAAITGINPELYEAAIVDGAGRLRKIWHITLPGIKSTIIVLLILSLSRIIGGDFDRNYNLMNPMVADTADIIATYVFRIGIQASQYNVATAVGLFQSVVGFILVLATNFVSKRMGEAGLV